MTAPADKNSTNGSTAATSSQQAQATTVLSKLQSIYKAYDFPINILLSLGVARICPVLGAVYVHPEITATWIAVIIIFIIVGLGLKTAELTEAFQRFHFNAFVQLYNFGFVSAGMYYVSRLLIRLNFLHQALADGLVVCSCLPMAINCLIVLTGSTGGDEAVAIFNTSFANIVGIFFSPLLILFYLGTSGSVDVKDTFFKLTMIVILPMIVGWTLQNYAPTSLLPSLYKQHKRVFKKTQESCLVFIIWTVFCKRFFDETTGDSVSFTDAMVMIGLEFLLMATFMSIAWYLLWIQFPQEPELRVTGLFACHHKTVALGVPLINSMYEHDPLVALYTLPILVWHPMQLVVGSFLVPALSDFIRKDRQRVDEEAADTDAALASVANAVSAVEDGILADEKTPLTGSGSNGTVNTNSDKV